MHRPRTPPIKEAWRPRSPIKDLRLTFRPYTYNHKPKIDATSERKSTIDTQSEHGSTIDARSGHKS